MSRFVTLIVLALRELWISFRLLLVVAVLVLTGLPAALLPHVMIPDLEGAPPDPPGWFALALAGAMALAAAMAAATLAAERRRGSAGWLAARAVPRPTILLSWFVAFGVVVAVGILPAAGLTWLSLADALPPGTGVPFGVAVVAAGCAGLAAVALGMLTGALLPPLPAGLAALLPAGAVLLAAAVGQSSWAVVPAGGLSVLAAIDTAARPIADAARAGGLALAAAAILLVAATVAFERADL